MNLPKIPLETYVDIAMCIAVQDFDSQRLQNPVWKEGGNSGTWDSEAARTELSFEIDTADLLKQVWSERIAEWQKLHLNGGRPLEDYTSLQDFSFAAFFLQRPLAAISLWNVMQNLYALDRLICGKSKEQREKVAEWESMPVFDYLGSKRIEKKWRSSLGSFKKDIEKEIKKEVENDGCLSRISDLWQGVAKLEAAYMELERNFDENLKDAKLASLMLQQIQTAVERKFSMVDKCLKVDSSQDDDGIYTEKSPEDFIRFNESSYKFDSGKSTMAAELDIVKPLARRNSAQVLKHHFGVVWSATNEGQPSLRSMIVLLISIICLYQVQRLLGRVLVNY